MNYYQPPQTIGMSRAGTVTLAEKVMGLTFFLIALATAGERAGSVLNNPLTGSGHYFLWVIAEIGTLIGAMLLADTAVLGFVLFCVFGFSTGVLLTPAITLLESRGLGYVVFEALLATAAVTGGVTVYARSTTRDFSGIGGYLIAGVIGIIVVGIVGIFIHSTILSILISSGACILFSFFLIYDIQRVTTSPDTKGNAIRLALGIYLDILNIFVALLNLLSILQGEDR